MSTAQPYANGTIHADGSEHEFQRVKALLHEQLVETFDLSKITRVNRAQMADEVRAMAQSAFGARKDLPAKLDKTRLMDELMDEIFGLGPLERLLKDPTINDILVNDSKTVYVERRGRLEPTDVVFADDQHLIRIIQKIVAKLGRRIDESSPMVDARLPDGSRVNAVIPPLAIDGPTLSIRRRTVEDGRPVEPGLDPAGDGEVRGRGGRRPVQPADLRRYGRR